MNKSLYVYYLMLLWVGDTGLGNHNFSITELKKKDVTNAISFENFQEFSLNMHKQRISLNMNNIKYVVGEFIGLVGGERKCHNNNKQPDPTYP